MICLGLVGGTCHPAFCAEVATFFPVVGAYARFQASHLPEGGDWWNETMICLGLVGGTCPPAFCAAVATFFPVEFGAHAT